MTSRLEIRSNLLKDGGGISLATFSEPVNVTSLNFENAVESKNIDIMEISLILLGHS